MKKISILLTSYNIEGYIDASIASVVAQEFPCDWELLIGDDGSNDGTVEKIEKWISKYPANLKLYRWSKEEKHSMNGFRAAANRANLLDRAVGDYIIFLDGDDCWLGTEKLKTQFFELEKSENTDCSCCAHNIYKYNISDDTGYNMVNDSIPTRKLSFSQYWGYLYFHTNTILFRKECKEIMLDSLYRGYLNDTFITFIMLQYGKVLYIKNVWAQYNITGTGLWTGNSQIYGYFRNMQLYDLEVKIKPESKNQIFMKHRNDFVKIINTYSSADKKSIIPLVSGLDEKIFKYTLLLSRLENLNYCDRFLIYKIKVKALFAKYKNAIIRRFYRV